MFEEKKTLLAFNIWNIESAEAVIDGASAHRINVILQTSTNVFKSLEQKSFANYIKSYAKSRDIKVWLNLDHCREVKMLRQAIDNGWDMVMADGSNLDIMDNLAFTNSICEYAHARDVVVEAELGQVKGVEEEIVSDYGSIVSMNDIDTFSDYCKADVIAVAFGNAHGMYKGSPQLDYSIVEYTTKKMKKPFAVHGGSGLSAETLQRLVAIPGVEKINISTELKLAFRKSIQSIVKEGDILDNQVQPIKISERIKMDISEVVHEKSKIIYG